MPNKYKYLTIWHDRHTDDRYIAYTKLENAIARCKHIVNNYYDSNKYQFYIKDEDEFCLFASDDYFIKVVKVEIVN